MPGIVIAPPARPQHGGVTMTKPGGFTRRRRRKLIMGLLLPCLAGAVVLVFFALRETAIYMYGPSELPDYAELGERQIRLGGLVAAGSLTRSSDGLIEFGVTDLVSTVMVTYDDILPGLFAEEQGVVVQGQLREDGTFVASKVLARHDENYMPAEVVDVLKENGTWQHVEDGQKADDDPAY